MSRTHCPHCGAPLPRGAAACPSCGSDEETGWASEEVRSEARWGSFDEDDYREVIRALPGSPRPRTHVLRTRILVAIALLALVLFLLRYVTL